MRTNSLILGLLAILMLTILMLGGSAFAQDKPPDVGKIGAAAAVAERVKKYEEALRLYRRAAALAPDNPQLHLNLAGCLTRLGRYQEAVAIYQRTLEKHRDQVAVQRAAVQALGFLEKAREPREAEWPVGVPSHLRTERLRELWADAGASKDEIDRRMVELEEARRRFQKDRDELEAITRRLDASRGEQSVEERRRARDAFARSLHERDEAWRIRRESDVHAARREFMRLAEVLGIPRPEVERLLEKREGSHWGHERDEDDRRPNGKPPRRMNDAEPPPELLSRLNTMEAETERTLSHIENRFQEIEAWATGFEKRLGSFLERIERRVAAIEEKLEGR